MLQYRIRALARWMSQPASIEQRNERNLLIDGIGVGVVTGVATFLPIFLVKLGSSPLLVGLLTAMPALTGMLLAIPIGQYLQGQPNIVPWYTRARVWVFASYAFTGLTPWLFSNYWASIAVIAIWAVATVPQTIVNVALTLMVSSVASIEKRYSLLTRRLSALGLATAVSVALVGGWLDTGMFPRNYQLVFIGSFVAGMLSFAFSSRIDLPDNQPDEDAPSGMQTLRRRLGVGIAELRENAAFSRFVISQFVFRFGLALALPLFPLYWVREVNASNTWIGIISTVQSAVLLGAYFFWARLSRRRGTVLVLRVSTFGLCFYPVLTGLTESVELLAVYAGIAGFFAAGMDLVLFDLLLNTCPPRRKASYIALHQFTTYVALLIAPLLGTLLADVYGFRPALFTSGAIRLAAFVLFVMLGVGMLGAPARRQTDSAISKQ